MRSSSLGALAIAILVVLACSFVLFAGTPGNEDGKYVEARSSVYGSLHTAATNGQVALTVNGVENASSPAMTAAWEQNEFHQNGKLGYYNHTLLPPAGEKYLIASVTVASATHQRVPFSFANMYLVGHDGNTYYANYAACDSACWANTLRNHTLDADSTRTMYVLFWLTGDCREVKAGVRV